MSDLNGREYYLSAILAHLGEVVLVHVVGHRAPGLLADPAIGPRRRLARGRRALRAGRALSSGARARRRAPPRAAGRAAQREAGPRRGARQRVRVVVGVMAGTRLRCRLAEGADRALVPVQPREPAAGGRGVGGPVGEGAQRA